MVVLKRDNGSVIDIYNGRKDKLFTPTGIVATEADTILITIAGDHTLHILNSSGKLISYFNVRDVGIELPFSISFLANGHFYIGGTTLKDSCNKAKLYEFDHFEI